MGWGSGRLAVRALVILLLAVTAIVAVQQLLHPATAVPSGCWYASVVAEAEDKWGDGKEDSASGRGSPGVVKAALCVYAGADRKWTIHVYVYVVGGVERGASEGEAKVVNARWRICLLYTSPSPRDRG